jgi:hypothetical protein
MRLHKESNHFINKINDHKTISLLPTVGDTLHTINSAKKAHESGPFDSKAEVGGPLSLGE